MARRNRTNRLSLESLEARNLMAAVDYFLKLDGIGGESTSAAEVDVPTNLASNGGEDRILIGMLVPAVQKVRDAAARMQGSHALYQDIYIPLNNADGTEYMTIKLQDVLISSIQKSSDEEILIGLLLPAVKLALEGPTDQIPTDQLGDMPTDQRDIVPTDQLSLNFAKIEFEYAPDLDLGFVDQDAEVYLQYKLKDCIVTSYSL